MNAAQLHFNPDTWITIITPRDVWHIVGKPPTIRVKVLYVTDTHITYDLTPMGYPLIRGGKALDTFYHETKYLYERSRPWCADRLEVELAPEQHAFLTDWSNDA